MKLEILCGPIASGKSTFCKIRAKEGAIIVNDDAIVCAVHGGNYSLYDKSLKILYKSIEFSIISHAFSCGRDVIIDRPCISRKTREKYIRIANGYDIPVEVIVFYRGAPELHGERRFNGDNRGHNLEYWINVAKFHDARYQAPHPDEGYDDLKEMPYSFGNPLFPDFDKII